MPRTKRCRISGIAQLLYQRGHNGGAIFTRESDYRTYLYSLSESVSTTDCRVHAYTLMRDCIYILCTPSRDDGVSRMMQAVGAKYACYFNNQYQRTGSLWDGRYRSCLVEPGRYLLACYLFVDCRPIDDSQHRENPRSSYPFHALGKFDSIIDDHWVYGRLATTDTSRQRAYRELVHLGLSPSLESEIGHALHHGLVLGRDSFKDEIALRGHGRVRMGKPGRPRKIQPKTGALRASAGTRQPFRLGISQ